MVTCTPPGEALAHEGESAAEKSAPRTRPHAMTQRAPPQTLCAHCLRATCDSCEPSHVRTLAGSRVVTRASALIAHRPAPPLRCRHKQNAAALCPRAADTAGCWRPVRAWTQQAASYWRRLPPCCRGSGRRRPGSSRSGEGSPGKPPGCPAGRVEGGERAAAGVVGGRNSDSRAFRAHADARPALCTR